MTVISPICIDLGAINTGLYLSHYNEGEDPTNDKIDKSGKVIVIDGDKITLSLQGRNSKRATIFAKACFGHPSPSKRQKSRGNQCLRRPDTSCVRVSASHHCKLDADSVTLPQMT